MGIKKKKKEEEIHNTGKVQFKKQSMQTTHYQ